ncbi:DUF3842 family protein [Alkaliphilus serpentinus]|uniref:DUF3842 family protein n=1 Tax=Alkaliphilus serpentinus TaxID=1482731 RepID=A0A833HQ94_9FIRM|nr:DUF3842 family protein [Alkaliphilus serpentinus]KAB3531560.1 DUF3842 family protein [Alkaliphilus serpentinus]
MKIAVIDGQGGGIGRALIERVKSLGNKTLHIQAFGTNTMATSNMLKAGADEGATGENPIIFNADRVDVIMGPIGIISANSMLGELTPSMANAISQSSATKILIPFNKCNIFVTGVADESLQYHLDCALDKIKELIQ